MSISFWSLIISVIGMIILPIIFHFTPSKKDNVFKTEKNKNKTQNTHSFNTEILQENSNYQINSNYQNNSNNQTIIITEREKATADSNAWGHFLLISIMMSAIAYFFSKNHSLILFIMMVLFSLFIGFPKDRYKTIFKSKSNICFAIAFIISVIFFVFPIDTTGDYIAYLNNPPKLKKVFFNMELAKYTASAVIQTISSITWMLLLIIDVLCKLTNKLPKGLYNLSITKAENKKSVLGLSVIATFLMSNFISFIYP